MVFAKFHASKTILRLAAVKLRVWLDSSPIPQLTSAFEDRIERKADELVRKVASLR